MKALRWLMFLACMMGSFTSLPSAHAWTKIKNTTPTIVSVAYAFSSVSGIGCGYSTCGGGWKSIGWFNIAPGGELTINSQAHHNAQHQFFAQDQAGRKWRGGGRQFEVRTGAFEFCNRGIFPGTWIETFSVISGSRCCGFTCSPSNFTLTLRL